MCVICIITIEKYASKHLLISKIFSYSVSKKSSFRFFEKTSDHRLHINNKGKTHILQVLFEGLPPFDSSIFLAWLKLNEKMCRFPPGILTLYRYDIILCLVSTSYIYFYYYWFLLILHTSFCLFICYHYLYWIQSVIKSAFCQKIKPFFIKYFDMYNTHSCTSLHVCIRSNMYQIQRNAIDWILGRFQMWLETGHIILKSHKCTTNTLICFWFANSTKTKRYVYLYVNWEKLIKVDLIFKIKSTFISFSQ